MEIHFDQKLLKLEDNPSIEQIEDASFRKLISYNFKENFSQYSKDELKKIKKLFYRKIDKETQSYLLQNPKFLNQKVELLFTASTDIDQIHKGNFNRNIPEKQRAINDFQLGIYDQFVETGKVNKSIICKIILTNKMTGGKLIFIDLIYQKKLL